MIREGQRSSMSEILQALQKIRIYALLALLAALAPMGVLFSGGAQSSQDTACTMDNGCLSHFFLFFLVCALGVSTSVFLTTRVTRTAKTTLCPKCKGQFFFWPVENKGSTKSPQTFDRKNFGPEMKKLKRMFWQSKVCSSCHFDPGTADPSR